MNRAKRRKICDPFIGIDLLGEINYFPTLSAVTLRVIIVKFVWFRLLHGARHTRDFPTAAFFEYSCFPKASTAVRLSTVDLNPAYCRVGAMSAPRHLQYNSPTWFLAQVFIILSTEGHSQSRSGSQIEGSFAFPHITSKLVSPLPKPETLRAFFGFLMPFSDN